MLLYAIVFPALGALICGVLGFTKALDEFKLPVRICFALLLAASAAAALYGLFLLFREWRRQRTAPKEA